MTMVEVELRVELDIKVNSGENLWHNLDNYIKSVLPDAKIDAVRIIPKFTNPQKTLGN